MASPDSSAQASDDADAFIVLRDLHKSFGKQEILCGIDLTLKHGETLCLIGPSG